MFEIALSGPSAGNPYKEVALTAVFTMDHRNVRVTGFTMAMAPTGCGLCRMRLDDGAM